MSKKAQVDMQFTWIFILLVGAIILGFFVGVSVWYKGHQENVLTADVVTKLDSLFMTAKESPKTARFTEVPDISLEFACSPYDCSNYGCPSSFSGGGISMATETEIVFAPTSIEGDNLITWALEWALPYKIANFLYVTNDRVRYILVYDDANSALAYEVNALLAENSYLSKEMMKLDTFALMDKNDAFVRIVAFTDIGAVPEFDVINALGNSDPDDPTWDIVYVEGSADYGSLIYYDDRVDYLGLPLLLGGIFSPNAAFYSCNVHKAGLQEELVSAVYLSRTQALYESTLAEEDLTHCQYYYDLSAQDAIDAVTLDTADYDTVLEQVYYLEENNAYAVIKNCPRVY